jgi:hypothetical protein
MGDTRVSPAAIEAALLERRAGVVFLPEKLVRRIIKDHRQIRGLGFQVPHALCYSVPRWALEEIVEATELASLPEGRLPDDHDTLLVLPKVERVAEPQQALIAVWRAALHAAVHRALEARTMTGELSPAAIRARVHAIGQTEFDEIRFVLKQDDVLLPPGDDVETYIEFAAMYVEQRHFAPDLLVRTFPGVRDHERDIDRLLARDIDVAALVESTRPDGAPSTSELWATLTTPPVSESQAPTENRAHLARETVDPSADRAKEQGNAVRSMLLRVRSKGTEAAVFAELTSFCDRLSAALVWVDAPTSAWANLLLPVVHHARFTAGVAWNAEARILFDLQKACIDNEREREAVGVVEWALSRGKVPVRRPLPAERDVRIAGHVLAALAKVPKTRLPEGPRGAVVQFLVAIAERAEGNVRTALGPRLEAALERVELRPENVTERASKRKLVDELLDQILKNRFITLSNVRDALSRNNLKMANVTPRELWSGDALLRMDKILERDLDGVYHSGEIYLRGLQKLSSVTFGSRVGRVLTLYLLLPVISAFVVLEGLQHTVGLLLEWALGLPHVPYATPTNLAVGSVLALALIHSSRARDVALVVWSVVKLVLSIVFVKAPLWALEHPAIRALFKSAWAKTLLQFVLKPAAIAAVLTGVVSLFQRSLSVRLSVAVAAFLIFSAALNSKLGRAIEEAGTDYSIRSYRQLSRRVLPGLLSLLGALFKRALEGVERLIYYVDEKLVFREGESKVTLYVKAGLGVVWFFTTYLIRIYVVLLIEPEVNPVKHFPVVTVAAKIMIPVTPALHDAMYKPLVPVLGPFLAESIAAPTVFVLPGFFGFLVWELKENWRLYRMNRSTFLAPVIIGSHGETMVQFMKPGLHSGTIPKVYAKLRKASRKLDQSALKHTEALRGVEVSIRKFMDRELVLLFRESPAWEGGELELGRIELASNRVRIEVFCRTIAPDPAVIVFDEQAGFLLAQVPEIGFIERLGVVDRIVMENALAGIYKMAGVDLVREQITQLIGGAAYDVAPEGLVVWPDAAYKSEVVFSLSGHGATIRPRVRAGEASLPEPLAANRLMFSKQPLAWASWVSAFATREDPPRRLNQGPSLFAKGQAASAFDRTVTLKKL